MNNTVEDNQIKALSKGDPKAFETLFLMYQPRLVFFLSGFIKNYEQARDMAQDIFLSIWNNKEKLAEVKSFKAYIFKMANNAICNYFDHHLVNEKYVAEQLKQSIEVETTEEQIYAQQLQVSIDLSVSQMPPKRKQIYIMSRVDGMSNDEIAKELKINKRTVENHLTAALADIRKVIKLFILFFH